LIEVDELELAFDSHGWFRGQGEWAKMGKKQIDQLVEYMRTIHKLKQANQLPMNHSGIDTAKRFSWSATVKKVIEGIGHV
jgi:hypothetical protein